MVRTCAFPGCGKKMRKHNPESFHTLPLRYKDRYILNQWLLVLKIDTETPEETLRQMDRRVCSAHFDEDDFSCPYRAADPNKPQRVHLKKNAVPRTDLQAVAAPSESLSPSLEDIDIVVVKEEEKDVEEEEIEEEEEEREEEEEEREEEEVQEGKRKPKRKRKNSDDEWAPSFEEVLETSGEESDGSEEEEEEGPFPLTWCHDCAEVSGIRCFKQKHLLLYCCVQCGHRDGYQEPKNTDDQETPRTSSPETPSAGHQEGTGDVNQADEGSCSPEDDGNNKPTYSDCPADPNSITNEGIINCDTAHRNKHDNQAAVSNDAGDLIRKGDSSHRACGIIEPGSVGSSHQGVTRSIIPEDTSSSDKDSNTSQIGVTSSQHKEARAVNQEKQNIPIYTVYFSDVDSLRDHMKESHGHKRELCPDCGKFLHRHKGKSSHVCKHKEKPFSCLTCGKYFASKAGLHIHNHVHAEDYMLSCRYCYKAFRFLEDKQQHEDSHQGEKLKYCCSDCPKRFADYFSRNAHRKTHWKHGKFICKICDKIFSDGNKLERHEAVHTGLKPYSCELCDRSFNQAGHLKSHMRVHTGEKPFKCQDCGLSFNHNVSLKNHVQRKHTSASDGDDW